MRVDRGVVGIRVEAVCSKGIAMQVRLTSSLTYMLIARVEVALLCIVDSHVVQPGIDLLSTDCDAHVSSRGHAEDPRDSRVEIAPITIARSSGEGGEIVHYSVIGMKDIGEGDLCDLE